MSSKLRQVGFLEVDNRMSGGAHFEADTRHCCHCPAIVIMNPNRIRPRHWCSRCDDYVCDNCALVPECTPIRKTYEEWDTAIAKGKPVTFSFLDRKGS